MEAKADNIYESLYERLEGMFSVGLILPLSWFP